jgi:hypothetical protein
VLISTHGNVSVPGRSAADEDILIFTPTSLGANTAGSWGLFFDGSDVGLTANSGTWSGSPCCRTAAASPSTSPPWGISPPTAFPAPAGTFSSSARPDGSAQGLGSNNVLDVSFAKSFSLPASVGSQGSRRNSAPAPEIHDAGAAAPGVNVRADVGAADFHQVVAGTRAAASFTPLTPVVAANSLVATLAAAPLAGDTAPGTLPSRVAVPSGRLVVSQPALPAPAEAADSPPAPASQAAPADLPAEIPLNVPWWRWATDAYFSEEMLGDWPDGEAAAEPAWLAPAVSVPQVALAGMLLGFLNAPVRGGALLDKEDRPGLERPGGK